MLGVADPFSLATKWLGLRGWTRGARGTRSYHHKLSSQAVNISYHHKLFRTLEGFIRPYSIASFYHIIL